MVHTTKEALVIAHVSAISFVPGNDRCYNMNMWCGALHAATGVMNMFRKR